MGFSISILLKYIWNYKYLLIIVFLFGGITLLYQNNKYLRKENIRQTNNIKTLNSNIDSFKARDGKYVFTMNQLEITRKELVSYNNDLMREIDNMRIKLKNVQSAKVINNSYEVVIRDTIQGKNIYDTVYLGDSLYQFAYNNNYIDFSGIIHTKPNVYLTNTNIKLHDTITIIDEIQYKRKWLFWRKAVGVKMYIKSENPYSKFQTIRNYSFIK